MMTHGWALVATICSLLSALCFVLAKILDTDARSMIEEFESKFPGRCVICSYARFGRQHGLTSATPAHEGCPERDDAGWSGGDE